MPEKTIKFLDLNRQYKTIQKEIDKAIHRVLGSGNFIGGSEVENFEKEVAKFCGSKYAISLNSGTDALFLALKALGIGRGDDVITSPFTFFATAEAIANTGAKPVFADIESDTFNISPELVEGLITSRTKVILPVHLFGQMADMKAIMKIAKKYKIKAIEDAAQSFGAEHRGRKSGSIGDVGCFSFFPSKNIGAFGDGGMAITNDKKIAEKLRLLRSHGSSKQDKYLNMILGTNSRLDSMQAAILMVKLKYINKWNKARIKKAEYYNKNLNGVGDIIVPKILFGDHVFHQYAIRVNGKLRNKLVKYLSRKGIPTMIYYPVPLHLQPVFRYLGYKKGNFPEAEQVTKEILSLPIFPELKREEQDFIISYIRKFYGRN